MSDEFLRVARDEIGSELGGLKQILSRCNSDQNIHRESNQIEKHLHKIKGLAPMIGQNAIGELAQISDAVLRHIINNGILNGSYSVVTESIQKMTELFSGEKIDVNEFRSKAREAFPQISGL